MNYQLALSLKEAGFPQHSICNRACDSSRDLGLDRHYPTLEELVDACGYLFFELHNEAGRPWRAIGHAGTFGGSTPIEAVARLWLALNAKQ